MDITKEVIFSEKKNLKLSSESVAELVKCSVLNPSKKYRLCAHGSPEEALHEMFIVHAKSSYVRPHKHLNKIESFSVISGEVTVVVYDDDGQIIDSIAMGDFASGKPFYYRVGDGRYHSMVITSEVLVFHEVTKGPFNREDTVFAPWSPDESNADDLRRFLDQLKTKINIFEEGKD